MSRIDDHVDEMSGLLFLEGQLDADVARAFSEHVESCSQCRALLRALEREGVWLREALAMEDEPVPARLLAAPKRSNAHWGWLVAFGLGIGGVYTLWTGFVEPWFSRAAQAGFTQGNLLTMLFFTGAFWKGWDDMRIATEFLAVATLAGVGIWLLRKQWRRLTTIAFVMGALMAALALPPATSAGELRRGDPSYTLPAGQEVNNDLIVYAVRTRIDGDVDGDLIVFSNSLTVNGHVKGDIIAFGQEVRVNGPVDGNVRVWAQTLALNSTVGKNVSGWTASLEMDEKATVGGTITSIVGAGEIDGRVGGDVLVAGGDISINGALSRDVRIWAQHLTIESGAEIKGRTDYQGRRQPHVSPSAKLGSPINVTIKGPGPDYSSGRYYWHQTLYWGASFIFGLVLLLIAPGFCFDAEQACKRTWPSLGLGAAFLFATPIAALIACLTIVGLGVGIATFLLYFIAIYSSQVFVGLWIGEKLLGSKAGTGLAVGRLALGIAIIHAVRMIPYAGPLVGLILLIWGMGALVLAMHRKMQPQLASPA